MFYFSLVMKEVLHDFSVGDYIPQGDYSFLDILGGNSYIYYSLIESIPEYKLKNLYRFIYLRILELSKRHNIVPEIKVNKESLSHSSLDSLLGEYIQDNQFLSVLIIHAIYHYHYPKKSFMKQINS